MIIMLEINTPFEILPIKPTYNQQEVEKAKKKILFRYRPDVVRNEKPDKLKKELLYRYREIFKLANSTAKKIKKGELSYSTNNYNVYRNYIKENLRPLNKNDFIIILKANDLPTNGRKNELEARIIENVPLYVVRLNLEEHQLREQYVLDIKDVLNELKDNKLVRILELKNIRPNGNKSSLINQIISNNSEEEINNLINQVESEINELKNKLNRLSDDKLRLILKNNDINSRGEKNILINKIIEQLPISEIEDNINRVIINKQKLLRKLYLITGKDELSDGFKQKLADNHLEIKDGIQIRNKLVSLINSYQIDEQNLESKINALIDKKSQEVIDETIKKLYNITGKNSINSKFLKKLKKASLDENDGKQIRNEVINDIKSHKVGKENLSHYINLKIRQLQLKRQNEKLEILYNLTGKTNIKRSYNNLLREHDLNNQEGMQIKEELINIIKETNIEKNEIETKLSELITYTAFKKLINSCNIVYLNQIAIINGFSKCNSKEKFIEYFLENISPSFNDMKLKSDINNINNVKAELVKLYKFQLEFILISNNCSSEGTKSKLIREIISNIHIENIRSVLSRFEDINQKLNQIPLSDLNFIVNENNIDVTGTKNQIINEINKKVPVNIIESNLKKLDSLKSKLQNLNNNELQFIAKSNNLTLKDDKNQLVTEIVTQIPLEIFSKNIAEISSIENFVNLLNDLQRQHLLRTHILNGMEDRQTQINEILEKVDYFEINDFKNELNKLKEELNNLNVLQLNHILSKHDLNIYDDKSLQINTILENISVPLIKSDVISIKELTNKINSLREDEIDRLLVNNKLRKSINNEENIKTIVENISVEQLNSDLLASGNAELIEKIENSILICPVKIRKGKQTIITEKYENSRFLLLFDDEKLFNEYKKTNNNIKKLEKNMDYFKKLINKKKEIAGILVRKIPEDVIIQKN